jgi:hypothetical protein
MRRLQTGKLEAGMELKYINIEKGELPINFQFKIENKFFDFRIRYNLTNDFFTVDLLLDGVELCLGERIVLENRLFSTIPYPFDHTYLIPMDVSSGESIITFRNFNEKVFIYIFELDKNGEIIED